MLYYPTKIEPWSTAKYFEKDPQLWFRKYDYSSLPFLEALNSPHAKLQAHILVADGPRYRLVHRPMSCGIYCKGIQLVQSSTVTVWDCYCIVPLSTDASVLDGTLGNGGSYNYWGTKKVQILGLLLNAIFLFSCFVQKYSSTNNAPNKLMLIVLDGQRSQSFAAYTCYWGAPSTGSKGII